MFKVCFTDRTPTNGRISFTMFDENDPQKTIEPKKTFADEDEALTAALQLGELINGEPFSRELYFDCLVVGEGGESRLRFIRAAMPLKHPQHHVWMAKDDPTRDAFFEAYLKLKGKMPRELFDDVLDVFLDLTLAAFTDDPNNPPPRQATVAAKVRGRPVRETSFGLFSAFMSYIGYPREYGMFFNAIDQVYGYS